MVESKNLNSKISYGVIIFILSAVSLLSIIPIWYTLMVSISDRYAVSAGKVFLLPVGFSLKSYIRLVGDTDFLRSFYNSIVRVLIGVGISYVVVVMMAYPLSKTNREFKGRDVFMWILVFTMLFRASLIPLYIVVKSYGLTNTVWALVLTHSVPVFEVILVVNYFRNSPQELQEAAFIDGAGPWYILLKIMIPIAKPVLATITLFLIVFHWNEFLYGQIFMSDQSKYPLQTYIRQMVVTVTPETDKDYELLEEMSNRTLNAAKIFVSMIPVLAIYPFVQRYFVTGITLGSVKG